MAHPVLWFEVLGTNGDALRQFYGSLFDWTFNTDNPKKYGVVNTGDTRGIRGGVGQGAEGYRPSGVTFYVETPDVSASLAEAERLGGKTLMPRTQMPDVTLGLFADPEGHIIGLIEAGAA
jgi:predicted enzyme related to lactoylglutathione lyase